MLFASGSVLAGAAIGSIGRPFGAQAACAVERRMGAQLYTVRGPLRDDAAGTLARLAALGIRDVELFGLSAEPTVLGIAPEKLRALVDANGLEMTFSHVSGNEFDVPAISRVARALGLTTIILATAPGLSRPGGAGPADRAALDRTVELLNRLGREFTDQGFTFGYHNHQIEFAPIDGIIPYDYLTERTDPALVRLEIDVGWLGVAGVDPVALIERHAGRVIACHLKDFTGTGPVPREDLPGAARMLVAPGDGRIDFPAVLAAMDAAGIRHGFIEIDVSDDPLAAIGRGARHLESLRDC